MTIRNCTGGAQPALLGEIVRRQLGHLIDWAGLPPPVADQTRLAFRILTAAAMDRPATAPFDGLSRINASGLPFQWSFCIGQGRARSLRFLCESGVPGQSSIARCASARNRLDEALHALGVPHPHWLDECVFAPLLPHADQWPAHWRSALWFGVGAGRGGVLIKPYVNLNRGTPLERWRRLGQVLALLERPASLARLCVLSGQVSRDSWPVGLAVDVLPDGSCGRLKIYFRSAAVGPQWLQRWYEATGAGVHARAVRGVLDAFPYCAHVRYPEHAFIVGLELHGDGDGVSLKTDFAITRWIDSDAAAAAGIGRVLTGLHGDPDEFKSALSSIGAWPPCAESTRMLRFVGLGHEPDGSRHLNVYVEPPLSPAGQPRLRAVRRGGPASGAAAARGLGFLMACQQDGLWHDYALPVGIADQWITAYVLWQLAQLPPALATDSVNDAIALACARLASLGQLAGGWGFNGSTDIDADSTSLAVLALRAHGGKVPAAALDFLLRCRDVNGGTATYPGESSPGESSPGGSSPGGSSPGGSSPGESSPGGSSPGGSSPGGSWAIAVTEVSAPALLALAGHQSAAQSAATLGFLARERRPDGTWPAYWWHTHWYPTFFAMRAHPAFCRDALAAPLATTLQQSAPIGAFETALQLLCCQQLNLTGRSRQLARLLADQQQADGGWMPSALLRLTDRRVSNPNEVINAGPSYIDQQRVFTTATAVAALIDESSRRASSA